jgi:hypothetical protein
MLFAFHAHSSAVFEQSNETWMANISKIGKPNDDDDNNNNNKRVQIAKVINLLSKHNAKHYHSELCSANEMVGKG